MNPTEKLSGATEITLWRCVYLQRDWPIHWYVWKWDSAQLNRKAENGNIWRTSCLRNPRAGFLIFNEVRGSFTSQIFLYKIFQSLCRLNFCRTSSFCGKKIQLPYRDRLWNTPHFIYCTCSEPEYFKSQILSCERRFSKTLIYLLGSFGLDMDSVEKKARK